VKHDKDVLVIPVCVFLALLPTSSKNLWGSLQDNNKRQQERYFWMLEAYCGQNSGLFR